MVKDKTLAEALKMSTFKSLSQKALLNVMYTGAWFEARVHDVLKEHGLTEQQFNVLRILKGQKGAPVNLNKIQERMLHRMSNATRIVEKLKQKGLVERKICESNRREVEITITKRGEEVIERVAPHMEEQVEEPIRGALSEEELEQLHALLEKMRT